MRNAVKRVTHKERAQPSSRKKFGLLEKHKDYVERAKDYKNKQTHLNRLRKKALDRNPDEFYFKMNTSQVRNGIHRIDNNKNGKLDNSVISTLKTQDLGYITVKKCADDSKIRRLKENLHLIGEQKVKSHKVFVSSEEEVEDFDTAEYFNTAPELVNRTFNRPKLINTSRQSEDSTGDDAMSASAGGASTEKKEMLIDPRSVATSLAVSSSSKKKSKAVVPAAYRELRERVKRSKKLKTAIEELSLQRNLTNSKGSKRKLVVAADGSVSSARSGSSDSDGDSRGGKKGGASRDSKEKVIYKWKRQRSQ